MKRYLLGSVLSLGLMVLGISQGSAADPKFANIDVPSPIRVIVAYNAGGSSDALARVTLPFWEKAIEELSGKRVNAVVVNLPGAGGEIGWTSLSHAQSDGSTIGIINLPSMPLVEAARDAGFEPWLEKFVPLAVNVIDPNVVRLAKSAKYGSLKEAIDAAKAKPGSVIVGADGPLSDDHLASYAVAQATGAEFAFVPYAGGAPANKAFQSGEVEIAIGNVFDHLKTKDSAKDAVVLRPTRYERMIPDIATAKDKLGVDVGDLGSTRGFAAPAGVPQELLGLYREAFRMVFNNQDYLAAAKKRNITTVEPRIGDEFGQVMKEQQALVGELMQLFVKGGYIKQ